MAKKDEIIEDDEEEIEVEADDADDESSGLPKWMPIAVIAVAVLGFGGLAWLAMDSGSEQTASYKEVPVIKAEDGSIKEKPTDPGGMKIAGQGREIFDAAVGKDTTEKDANIVASESEEAVSPEAQKEQVESRSNLLAEESDKEKKVEKIASKPVEEAAKPTEIKTAAVNKQKAIATAPVAADTESATKAAEKVKTSDKLASDAKDKNMKSAAVAEAKATPSATGDVKIQIGAYRSEQEAVGAWKKAATNNKDVLSSKVFTIQKAEIEGKGIFYRLQVGGFKTSDDASSTCKTLSSRKTNCFVVR